MDYNIDNLGLNPQGYLKEPVPSAQNGFSEAVGPQALGTGEQGTQLLNVGRSSRIITVKPGEDIQDAIDKMAALETGGTVLLLGGVHTVKTNITGRTGVSIMGEGTSSTVVNFSSSASSIIFNGTSTSDTVSDFKIQNLSITGSTTHGISILFAKNFELLNVYSYDNGGRGFSILDALSFRLHLCAADDNTSHGFYFDASTSPTRRFSVESCTADSNGGSGFYIAVTSFSRVSRFLFFSCTSSNNTVDGFNLSNTLIDSGVFSSCEASTNVRGFYAACRDVLFENCQSFSNTTDFSISNTGNTIINGQGTVDVTSATFATIISSGGTNVTNSLLDISNFADIPGNFSVNGPEKYNRRTIKQLNTSGSTISPGSVVVRKPVSSGTEMITTTTAGDKQVLGVLVSAGVGTTNNNYGNVVTEGFVNNLKVDGTTDIAIGDFLSTFTTAGIAAKASSGHTAFAIALEAYTTNDSAGVIDALIVSPRYIA
jgi:hypothetical protein